MISKEAQPYVMIGCVVAMVISIFFISRGCKDSVAYTKDQLQRLETDAEFRAQDTAEFLGTRTDVLIVYLEVPGSKGLEEIRDAFKNVLTANGKNIVGVEAFQPTEGGPYFNPLGWTYTLEEMQDLVSQSPKADVIVSLAGVPVYDPDAIDAVMESFTPMVVGFFPGQVGDVAAWFETGIVEMAIMHSPAKGAAEPTTPRERYDNRFRMFTPDSDVPPPMPMMMM